MSIHGVLELEALLPADVAASLKGDDNADADPHYAADAAAAALPSPEACARAVAAALQGAPRFEELVAALTAQHGSACAKDAAGAFFRLRPPACRTLR
jgi:hypothetical protein